MGYDTAQGFVKALGVRALSDPEDGDGFDDGFGPSMFRVEGAPFVVNLVTSSKASVTSSVALVSTSFLLLLVRHLLLLAMHLFLAASCY